MAINFPKIERSQGSKNFLKIKDGEFVVGVFRGKVAEFYQLWTNGRPQLVPKGTPGAVFRFRINFICKDEKGKLVAKLWDGGKNTLFTMLDMDKEYKGLDKIFVKITRTGSGTDTTYSLMPLLKHTPDQKELEQVPLQELVKSQDNPPMNEPPFPSESEAPIFEDEDPDRPF